MKRTLASLLVLAVVALAGCATQCTPTNSTTLDANAALTQISGVASAMSDIIKTSPLVATEQGQAVAGWASSVSTFATDLQKGLASEDQLAGAYTALRNTVTKLPLDQGTMSQITPYIGWADVAAQVLGLTVNVIKGAKTPGNPTSLLHQGGGGSKRACSSCHFQTMAQFGSIPTLHLAG